MFGVSFSIKFRLNGTTPKTSSRAISESKSALNGITPKIGKFAISFTSSGVRNRLLNLSSNKTIPAPSNSPSIPPSTPFRLTSALKGIAPIQRFRAIASFGIMQLRRVP
ncbi:MAG: hypothetical protein LH649_12335 [Pseudanabaena sp. CAN_BIN31]|nr:hypothetical protein [Pseudanabaena sp. CAN_BIN31]